MPLLNGHTDEVMNENVAELRRTGYPEDQAVAIALKKQRESQKANDEQASNPLAAAAKKAADVRSGKMSAADAASGPTVLSSDVEDALTGAEPKPKVPENNPSGQAAPKKKDKPLPKFKGRGTESHKSGR